MEFDVDSGTLRFIRNLPKTETHLHLEGALPLELLQKVAPEEFAHPPASWRQDFRFGSFADFERELLHMAGLWYTSPERYHDAAKQVFEGLVYKQNVHYVETSFASGVVEALGLDGKAVAEAIKSAAPRGLHVRLFMGIHHDGYHEGTKGWIDDALTWQALDGIDLHGTETTPVGPWAESYWTRARDEGKYTKAHAGEFAGPDFVRWAVEVLGVTRIQHGARAAEDPEVMALLADRDVTLDMAPISNVKLQVASAYDDHPIARLMDAGIRCTVSTDDPISFGNVLLDEYRMLAGPMGFDRAGLARVARAGFEVAIMDPADRDRWLADFDGIVAPELGRTPGLRKV
ncbi:MAG: hypothetical protein JJ896_12760 [Rhodothermales bacterium]|nr:hypothetical protein [Rhodothermales bacterium]MBO6780518.1 hypothetical protein [Rhodothermales bacterium]